MPVPAALGISIPFHTSIFDGYKILSHFPLITGESEDLEGIYELFLFLPLEISFSCSLPLFLLMYLSPFILGSVLTFRVKGLDFQFKSIYLSLPRLGDLEQIKLTPKCY